MPMGQKVRIAVQKVDYIVIVVSCLELPNKVLGKKEMLLGLVVIKMKVGRCK